LSKRFGNKLIVRFPTQDIYYFFGTSVARFAGGALMPKARQLKIWLTLMASTRMTFSFHILFENISSFVVGAHYIIFIT
jgi:hypothetical protein